MHPVPLPAYPSCVGRPNVDLQFQKKKKRGWPPKDADSCFPPPKKNFRSVSPFDPSLAGDSPCMAFLPFDPAALRISFTA